MDFDSVQPDFRLFPPARELNFVSNWSAVDSDDFDYRVAAYQTYTIPSLYSSLDFSSSASLGSVPVL